jgi:uncharacterized protein (TIGR02145 family)
MDKVKKFKLLESLFSWKSISRRKNLQQMAGRTRGGSITDVQPTIEQFKPIKIFNHSWMVENLNVSKFRNGDEIPEVKTNEEWTKSGAERKPAWCYYNNDPENGKKYGKLYNGYAVLDPRGLAPAGWYIPSNGHWEILTDNLGWENEAGKKMKSTSGWNKNGNGTNSSGITALPAGQRSSNGSFNGIGDCSYWWSSTEKGSDWSYGVWYRSIVRGTDKVLTDYESERYGFSVRCIKVTDQEEDINKNQFI